MRSRGELNPGKIWHVKRMRELDLREKAGGSSVELGGRMDENKYARHFSRNPSTNNLKKGDRVLLRNGCYATIEDNMRGNTRLATVEGYVTEMGSVYGHDIMYKIEGSKKIPIGHTKSQVKVRDMTRSLFGENPRKPYHMVREKQLKSFLKSGPINRDFTLGALSESSLSVRQYENPKRRKRRNPSSVHKSLIGPLIFGTFIVVAIGLAGRRSTEG